MGVYRLEQPPNYSVKIAEQDGKVFLNVPGQPPYELKEKEKDVYFSPTAPEVLSRIQVKRDAAGKIAQLISTEPSGTYTFTRFTPETPKMAVEELMSKVVDALGGEINWRKFNSRVVKYEIDLVHQGVKGYGTQYAKAPNMTATESTFTAAGKPIATAYDYFNGAEGGEESSFSTFEKITGKSLEDARINADFYGLANWKANYKKTEMKPMAKIGDEDVYVVVLEPEKGNKDTFFISAKTFLPVKLDSVISSSTRGVDLPYTETYSDYRAIDGIKIPFRTVNSNVGNGDVVTIIKEVKHNATIDDKVFRLKN
jgi:hypothetical protein